MYCQTRFVFAGFLYVSLFGSAAAEEMRGIIKMVDPAKGELVAESRVGRNRGLPVTFRLGKDTQVLAGREIAAIEDLKPGMRARIAFERQNGSLVATGISVRETLTKSDPQPPPDVNTLTGTIARISFAEREIVVVGPGPKGDPKTESLWTLPENMSITREKKAIKFDDLREGERVVIRTEVRNDKTVPVSVEVGVPAAAVAEQNPRLERLRRVLKITDLILEQMAGPKK